MDLGWMSSRPPVKLVPSDRAFSQEEEDIGHKQRFEAGWIELECEVSRNPSFCQERERGFRFFRQRGRERVLCVFFLSFVLENRFCCSVY